MKKVNLLIPVLTVVFIASSVLIFSGCKKYKDGPLISFRSKTERVANTWKFAQCTIDGKDLTTQNAAEVITFTEDKKASFATNDAAGDVYGGTWDFKHYVDMDVIPNKYSTDKDSISITVYSGLDNISNYYSYSYDCKIIELKQNNLHIQGNYIYTFPGVAQADTTIQGTIDWKLTKK